MRRIRHLACLLAACLPVAGLAAQTSANERWHRVVNSNKGQIFLDPATLQRDGDSRTILIRAILAIESRGVASTHVRMRFDCARRTFTLLHMTAFAADGSQLLDGEAPAEVAGPHELNQDPDNIALVDGVCAL